MLPLTLNLGAITWYVKSSENTTVSSFLLTKHSNDDIHAFLCLCQHEFFDIALANLFIFSSIYS